LESLFVLANQCKKFSHWLTSTNVNTVMYVRCVAIGGQGPASSLCDMYLTAKYLKRAVCAQNYHLLVLPFLLSFVNVSYRRLLFPLTLAPSRLRVPASSLSWSCQKVERCFRRRTSHTFLDLPTHKYSSADLPKHLLPLNFLQCRSPSPPSANCQ
jgi:hypothetical protein